jgi:hypothetical protein
MKTCTKCCKKKDLSCFGKNKATKDGRSYNCYGCNNPIPKKPAPAKHYMDYIRQAGMTEAYKRSIKVN